MYVDHDTNNRVSLLEITRDETYVMTEALVRFATNPDIDTADREKAKHIAYLISKEDEYTRESKRKAIERTSDGDEHWNSTSVD